MFASATRLARRGATARLARLSQPSPLSSSTAASFRRWLSGGNGAAPPPPPAKKAARMRAGRTGSKARPPPGGGARGGGARRAPGGGKAEESGARGAAGETAGAGGKKSKGPPYGLIGGGVFFGGVGWWYSSLDEEGNATGPLKDVGDWINAQAANVMGLDGKPSRERLLPDILPHMRYPNGKAPLTLVVAIDDTLLHESWHRRTGFRLAKRPGVDKFLHGVSNYYEVVLWSELAGGIGQEVVFNLDQQRGHYHHELHQDESCAIGRKQYVKDLSYLNRDLRRVIVIDSNPKNLRRQPENLCEITPFTDPENQTGDTELLDLIPFLQQVAIQQMRNDEPVTDILARYGNKDVGAKYKRKIEAMAADAERISSSGLMGALKKKREGKTAQ